MDATQFVSALNHVRETTPLVHCITNYVTVNDCANALLAIGGSPIMSDEPEDVEDITTICNGLVLNIGTLNKRSIEGMEVAGKRAGALGHPIVLDPVGAGASKLRTETAGRLMDELPITVVRGNMSEVKALAGAAAATRGVDVNPADVVTRENLAEMAFFARSLSQKTNSIIATTGAIDLIAYGDSCYAVFNGTPVMGRITGAGCMLSCVVAAYVAANQQDPVGACVAAIALMGLAGEQAAGRMMSQDGNGTFRTYLLDALYTIDGEALAQGARVEEIA